MSSSTKVYEEQLYQIWKNQNFSSPLKTTSGLNVEIQDSGHHDSELAGPDFKHARVRIGNLAYVGDIEIDPTYADWKNHGHNIDKKYNKVVLHVTLTNHTNQHFVYNRDGRKIPTLCLGDFIDSEITSTFEEKVHKKEIADNKLRCTPYTDQVTEEQKRKFLATLGVDRIRKKVDRFYDRLCELTFIEQNNIREPVVTYDLTPEFRNKKFTAEDFHSKTTWQQLLYESIFEALGYSQNKSIMQKLAQSVDVQYLSKTFIDQPIIQIEASLFNIGGLAPKITEFNKDKVSEYVRNISQSWETLSKIYDGQTFDETDWHFFRLRPHNFPTVRIAGGARLINEILNKKLIEVIITKIKEIKNYNVLINSIRSLFIVKAEGYWHNHYVFEDNTNMRIKYFVGAARADEIVINIIIPFFILYFDIFHQPENSRRVLKMYHIYIQKGENRIVHDVADSLNISDLLRRTIYTQGMLELFRNYCSKGKCMECEIGKVVFE